MTEYQMILMGFIIFVGVPTAVMYWWETVREYRKEKKRK